MTAYNEVQMNPNDGSWWYVRDGLVDFSYTGMGTGMIGPGIHLTPGISETDRSIFHITEYLSTR